MGRERTVANAVDPDRRGRIVPRDPRAVVMRPSASAVRLSAGAGGASNPSAQIASFQDVPHGVRLHRDVEDAAGRLGDPARATGAWRPVRGGRRRWFERVDHVDRLVDRLEDLDAPREHRSGRVRCREAIAQRLEGL